MIDPARRNVADQSGDPKSLLNHYRAREKDYFLPERAKFEIMSVKFANFPDKQQANVRFVRIAGQDQIGANLFSAGDDAVEHGGVFGIRNMPWHVGEIAVRLGVSVARTGCSDWLLGLVARTSRRLAVT